MSDSDGTLGRECSIGSFDQCWSGQRLSLPWSPMKKGIRGAAHDIKFHLQCLRNRALQARFAWDVDFAFLKQRFWVSRFFVLYIVMREVMSMSGHCYAG